MSRETAPNGYELIHVLVDGVEWYSFWHNPKTKTRDSPPKNTGGKKPYLMVMVQEIELLRGRGVDNVEELVGFIVCLGKSIEWSTGRLIKGRKKESMQYADLVQMFSGGRRKLDRIIKQLKDHELIYHSNDGYFVGRKIIKKGGQ